MKYTFTKFQVFSIFFPNSRSFPGPFQIPGPLDNLYELSICLGANCLRPKTVRPVFVKLFSSNPIRLG